MNWTHTDRSLTPTEAARLFIRDSWPEPRFILGGQVSGKWIGMAFRGWFHLVDGTQAYTVEGDAAGRWQIYREVQR